MIIEPATLSKADDDRIRQLASTLADQRMTAARYVTGGGGWVNLSDLESVHEVDLGVELLTDSGFVLEFRWATPGREEGMVLALKSPIENGLNEGVDVVDVSLHPHWSQILGNAITEVAVSLCLHGDGVSIRPWSYRLGFSNGSAVTLALGETQGNLLRYLPDSIVVIFEPEIAKAYKILDGHQPAWGVVVAPN